MGLFSRDKKVTNIDPNLLAQVRGCKMGRNGEPFTKQETFESIRDRYTLTPDQKIWDAIDYVYDEE